MVKFLQRTTTPPYPGRYKGKFSNSNNKIIFDIVNKGEGFEEGVNTVTVKIGGTTRISKNMWNPLNWFSTPTETAQFQEITKNKDVTVEVPYHVEKRPNLDKIVDDHIADIDMELWVTNNARKSLKGNNLYYEKPWVTTVGTDGVIPPYDGSSNNEKMVMSDNRTHSGPDHPTLIHLLPDFDPIKVEKIIYKEWDLPSLQGTIYQRSVTLKKTEPWCQGNGKQSYSIPGDDFFEEEKKQNMP